MKLGIITNAGGSAFQQIAAIAAADDVKFAVVTDRECGAEQVAVDAGAELIRIYDRDRVSFSRKAAEAAKRAGIEQYLLFFDRLISAELYSTVPTFNVHPSLLPLFKGLSGAADAHASGMRVAGCTLHEVDQSVDGGEIISQIACAADPDWTFAAWQKIAYISKVYCGLVWISLALELPVTRTPVNASHGLPASWWDRFLLLQEQEGMQVVCAPCPECDRK